MKKHNHSHDHNLTATAEAPTGALATIADVAGEKLDEARQHVTETAEQAQEATENFLRARPYHSIAIALGLGALFGYIVARKTRSED